MLFLDQNLGVKSKGLALGLKFLLLVHLVAAIFSQGFYHFDEHFQILEFVAYKMDWTSAQNLTWEFHERMRPWLMPWLFFGPTKILSLMGIESPHFLALFYRLISAAIGLVGQVVSILLVNLFVDIEELNSRRKKILLWALITPWFLPYFHARSSADNWGASLYLLALCCVLKYLPLDFLRNFKGQGLSIDRSKIRYPLPFNKALLAGLLFGLSFQCRYQLGIAIFLFYLWCLLYGRLEIKSGLYMSASLVLSLLIGLAIDIWGYNQLTFAPWNYLYQDFVLHVQGNHLPNPWYDYLKMVILKGIPPLSLLYLIIPCYFCFKFPKHPLSFCCWGLFLIHQLITHKELRFLMLIIYMAPLYIALYLSQAAWVEEKRKYWGLKIAAFLNLLILFVSIFKPANVAISFYAQMDRNNIQQFFYQGENPYTMVGAPLNFYSQGKINSQEIDTLDRLEHLLNQKARFNLVTVKGQDYFKIKNDYQDCHPLFSTYPLWSLDLIPAKWLQRSRIWVTWNCQKN